RGAPNRAEGAWAVAREPCRFLDAAQRAEPAGKRQRALPESGQAGLEVPVLDDPLPACPHPGATDGLPREVAIETARHVHPLFVHEQPERRPDARVRIEEFVQAVAAVVSVADVQNAAIPDGLHEGDRQTFDGFVVLADAQAGRAAMGWVLSQLPAREGREAF